jgi:hypothetical protein
MSDTTIHDVDPRAVLEARRLAEEQTAAAVKALEDKITERAELYRAFGKEIRIEFGPVVKVKRTIHRRTHAEIAAEAAAKAGAQATAAPAPETVNMNPAGGKKKGK